MSRLTLVRTGRPPRGRLGIAGLMAASMLAACAGPLLTAGPGATAVSTAATGSLGPSEGPTVPPSGEAGAAPAGCDLLTNDEIKDASGFTVAASSATDADIDFTATSGCAWTFDGNIWKLIVGVTTPGGDLYDRTFELEGGKEISGLGDRAFRGDASNVVFAQVGETLLTLQFVGAGIPDSVDEQLATRAVARLRG